jgi:hypothetical protein
MNECGAQPITHSSYYYIDGLGYYDDGEDRLGDEAAEEQGRTTTRNVRDRPPTLRPPRSNELAKQRPCYWKRRNLVKTILLKVVIKDK